MRMCASNPLNNIPIFHDRTLPAGATASVAQRELDRHNEIQLALYRQLTSKYGGVERGATA
jgi:hypothetical protein